MSQDCAGSGHELPQEPPPNEAATCPECGREVRVDVAEADDGQRVTVERHQAV
ncbi:hypothetical protein [Mycolicibacterium madagascariense]|uniref:hypothetical protein n=1 Tax=Mycolicibacterium madagascariense TaxID=212765 RepID=UPI0014781712|nr:hypothetical protein [Mycolicibacterium madagascariense]MCV7012962.1 hypothetical protein [Mycolicibacterium madagascariense]